MIRMRYKRLSLNRRELLTASILGVVAGVIASFAERADALLTSGNATPLGFINTYTWILVSAALFGIVGAIVTTEIQAFIGLMTLANPLSWLWPFVNLIFALAVGIVSLGIVRFNPSIKLRTRIIYMSITCAVLDVPLTYLVIVVVLGLPFFFYVMALPVYISLQLVPSTILAYTILKVILQSRLISSQLGRDSIE